MRSTYEQADHGSRAQERAKALGLLREAASRSLRALQLGAALTLAAALAGCAGGHPLDCATGLIAWNDCAVGTAGYNKRLNAESRDQQRCAAYGFQPGTDHYAQCVMSLDLNRDQSNDALLRAVYGGMAQSHMSAPPAVAPAAQPNKPVQCTTQQLSGGIAQTTCQ